MLLLNIHDSRLTLLYFCGAGSAFLLHQENLEESHTDCSEKLVLNIFRLLGFLANNKLLWFLSY